MFQPSELNLDEILKYMTERGGKVTNHDLVKHFKKFLTHPESRDEARANFKKYVNTLATIKNEDNVKWLVLKKRYMKDDDERSSDISHSTLDLPLSPPVNKSQVEIVETPQSQSINKSQLDLSYREPPPYIPPPIVVSSPKTPVRPPKTEPLKNIERERYSSSNVSRSSLETLSHGNSTETLPADEMAPKIIPRRRSSSDKLLHENLVVMRKSISVQESMQEIKENVRVENDFGQDQIDQKISVKERKQMFNRMAQEGDVQKLNTSGNRKSTLGVDDDDRGSVLSLDRKGHEWILLACRGDYHTLAKMLSENPKLAKVKDPATTAMHWACKRGDADMVKLLGGFDKDCVKIRSGYTPLHIAMQFRHENVFKLLVDCYGADPNKRDWAGRKPRQYLTNAETLLSSDTYRKFKLKSSKKKNDKDLGFLRIGSLNARVKKTTEAFSNFLGVGSPRGSLYTCEDAAEPCVRNSDPVIGENAADHIHKMWGSADNIQNDNNMMPPPASRRSKVNRASTRLPSRSTPSTPSQYRTSRSADGPSSDSDSDTAFGFDSNWKKLSVH